jgi:hypothetical protein
MIEDYINQENTIILAVSPANQESILWIYVLTENFLDKFLSSNFGQNSTQKQQMETYMSM